jgi:hypothetical protein
VFIFDKLTPEITMICLICNGILLIAEPLFKFIHKSGWLKFISVASLANNKDLICLESVELFACVSCQTHITMLITGICYGKGRYRAICCSLLMVGCVKY